VLGPPKMGRTRPFAPEANGLSATNIR